MRRSTDLALRFAGLLPGTLTTARRPTPQHPRRLKQRGSVFHRQEAVGTQARAESGGYAGTCLIYRRLAIESALKYELITKEEQAELRCLAKTLNLLFLNDASFARNRSSREGGFQAFRNSQTFEFTAAHLA
ncbi:MAG: hypothetical protein ACLQVA_18640 [Candidatus Brocadiia bacterium]